jgi:hypothetical protein
VSETWNRYANTILTQRIAADAHKVMESERDGIATGVGYHERRVADVIYRQKQSAYISAAARKARDDANLQIRALKAAGKAIPVSATNVRMALERPRR